MKKIPVLIDKKFLLIKTKRLGSLSLKLGDQTNNASHNARAIVITTFRGF